MITFMTDPVSPHLCFKLKKINIWPGKRKGPLSCASYYRAKFTEKSKQNCSCRQLFPETGPFKGSLWSFHVVTIICHCDTKNQATPLSRSTDVLFALCQASPKSGLRAKRSPQPNFDWPVTWFIMNGIQPAASIADTIDNTNRLTIICSSHHMWPSWQKLCTPYLDIKIFDTAAQIYCQLITWPQ